MLAWIEQRDGSPLPPLAGAVTAPQIEISGATLEGVEVQFDDSVPPTPGTPQ
jgi:hypothetical protein